MPSIKVRVYEDERYPDYRIEKARPKSGSVLVEVTPEWYAKAVQLRADYDRLMDECEALLNAAIAPHR